ncbi:MAG: ABC transporter permease [Anaerolineae bacterium]
MTNYLIRRALQGILTLFLMLTAAFFLVQLIMPGDYVSQFSMFLTGPEREALREQLGLNLPLHVRYIQWLGRTLTLDFGMSLSGQPVGSLIVNSASISVLVFATGLLVSYSLGRWLGTLTAWRGRTFSTDVTTFGVVAFYAFFPPALAFILDAIFARSLGLFPANSELFLLRFAEDFQVGPGVYLPRMMLGLLGISALVLVGSEVLRRRTRRRVPGVVQVTLIFGLWAASWFAMGFGAQGLRLLWWMAIPIAAFIMLSLGEIMVISRTSMADTILEQYVETAKAKGLPDRIVRSKHAARNAQLPVLSKLVVSLPYLLAGLIIIEYSLNLPGMGTALFGAVSVQDYPIVQGFLLVIGVVTLLARLLLDVMYALLDPRIRFANS